MKKFNKLLAVSLLLAGGLGALTSCGAPAISVWVGQESATFYQQICNKYLEDHPEFKFKISVKGTDTGTNGGAMMNDATACGDIITVAHDNIGKLVEKGYVLPIYSEKLQEQVKRDNPESYQNVINVKYNGETNLYGVPYISQALFLYYNKDKVSEVQAQTFEGLREAAASVSSKTRAVTVSATDGYNYSFNLLAVNDATKATTLKLYKNLNKNDCYFQGPDSLANLKWAQRYFNEPNGGVLPTDNGWASDIKKGNVVSFIGGAWHYDAFVSAVGGTEHMGIAKIPTYRLTSEDVEGITGEGAPTSGTVMRGGTFADCKAFLINFNAAESKYEAIQELIGHLASKEIQLESFKQCQNVPAYVNSQADIEAIKDSVDKTVYDLAKTQIDMTEYGIPQPMCTGTLNSYYYSMGAPDYYKNAVLNKDGFYTNDKLREVLYTMEYIWQKGKKPAEGTIPDILPSDVE